MFDKFGLKRCTKLEIKLNYQKISKIFFLCAKYFGVYNKSFAKASNFMV